MKILISFFILFLVTWFEVYRDRRGDTHPNNDWEVRLFLCCILGTIVATILPRTHFFVDALRYTVVAGCIFSAVFPYWINYVHLKNSVTYYTKPFTMYRFMTTKQILDHVVNHLSVTAWPDRTKIWRDLGWTGRLVVHSIFLIAAIIIFFW